MMLVLRGQVRISILSEEGKELVFNLIQPGECFGEIALLDGQPRSAAATAVGQCVLFTLARTNFIPFLLCHPQAALGLLAVLCERLRTTSMFIERLVFQNLPARLAACCSIWPRSTARLRRPESALPTGSHNRKSAA